MGVPKEALNYSSSEGLGGAGSVLSQRSMLYANSLQRLETAYKEGWRDAINTYFRVRNMNSMVDGYVLNMQPIITALSTIISEKRDSAVNQASSLVQLLSDIKVSGNEPYLKALQEALKEEFPDLGSSIMSYNIHVADENNDGGGDVGDTETNADRFNF